MVSFLEHECLCFCGVVAITWVSHTQGPRFDPGQKHFLRSHHSMVTFSMSLFLWFPFWNTNVCVSWYCGYHFSVTHSRSPVWSQVETHLRTFYSSFSGLCFGTSVTEGTPRLLSLSQDRSLVSPLDLMKSWLCACSVCRPHLQTKWCCECFCWPQVEYDLANSSEDDLRLLAVNRIEQSAVPLTLGWYPSLSKEPFIMTTNDQVGNAMWLQCTYVRTHIHTCCGCSC